MNEFATNNGITWGVGPAISWTFPEPGRSTRRIRQAKANTAAALASFDAVVLQALKETEQALALYRAELDRRQALAEAQDRAQKAFDMAHGQFIAGAVSNLDLLTSEQQLVATDAAVAGSDAALVQDQIAVFKALGGGWRNTETAAQPMIFVALLSLMVWVYLVLAHGRFWASAPELPPAAPSEAPGRGHHHPGARRG